MDFLCHLCLRTKTAPRSILTADLVQSEILKIHQLLVAGTIRHAWKKADELAVIFLFDAANEEDCRAIIASLPFSVAGILGIQFVIEVKPYLDVYPERTSD
jgi:muconolactone delta-isomerase